MDTISNCHNFAANFIDISMDTDDGNIYFFSIADDNMEPEHYIIIEYSSLIDEQDIELGQDKEYFLSSCTDGGYYGVVQYIHIYNDKICIHIKHQDGDIRSFVATFFANKKYADGLYKQILSIHQKTASKIETVRM